MGNKTDLRSNASDRHISTEMGERLSYRINAAIYVECSTSKGEEVEKYLRKLPGARFATQRKDENQNLSGFRSFLVENNVEN